MASDGEGNVAAWDPGRTLLGRWNRLGRLADSCVLDDPTLPSEGLDLALSGDRALLSFLDAAVEEQDGRREAVVDLRKCEVVSTFAVKGITTSLAGAPDGWVQASSPDELRSGRFTLEVLDGKGKRMDEMDLSRRLDRVLKENAYTARLGPRDVRPLVVGKEVWVIPGAAYELWRPPQHGKPFRSVAPPACLAARGRELTGEANVQHVLALSKHWPEEIRTSIERGARHGGLAPSFLAATAWTASWDRFVAVQVRDWGSSGAERLDVWNMDTESVVAVVGIPGTARLVAFNEAGLWVKVDDGRLERLPVPDLWPEAFDPCAAVADLKRGAAAPDAVKTNGGSAGTSPVP